MFAKTIYPGIALLSGLAACAGTDATALRDPQNGRSNVVVSADHQIIGRTYTAQEGIAFLERYEATHPGFLDQAHSYTVDGKENTATFRTLLNTLKGGSSTDASLRRGYDLLDGPPALKVINPQTTAGSGAVKTDIPVGASMGVSPSGTYSAKQTITIHNVGPNDINLPFTRGPSSSFPWAVAGSFQSLLPGTYNASTLHTVTGGGESASASSTAAATVSPGP